MRTNLYRKIDETLRVLEHMRADAGIASSFESFVDLARRTIEIGGGIFFVGNGGSAATAAHFSAEICGKYSKDRRGGASYCLSADATLITALANDYGVSSIFSRQVESLMSPLDMLVCFTTSGTSQNIVHALKSAGSMGIRSTVLCGARTSDLPESVTCIISVPSTKTSTIQECHDILMHSAMESIDGHIDG